MSGAKTQGDAVALLERSEFRIANSYRLVEEGEVRQALTLIDEATAEIARARKILDNPPFPPGE